MRDVQDAVSRPLDALGRDAIRDDVPASAFEARREAARKAAKLMCEHRKVQAHRPATAYSAIAKVLPEPRVVVTVTSLPHRSPLSRLLAPAGR